MVLNNSTFNLPNCGDHIPWQTSKSHELIPLGTNNNGSLPNIAGNIGLSGLAAKNNNSDTDVPSNGFFDGCFFGYNGGTSGRVKPDIVTSEWYMLAQLSFDASLSNNIYTKDSNIVIPSYVIMNYCIKY